MPRGGKRPNACRKKGTLAKSTLEAIIYREALTRALLKEKASVIRALIRKAKKGDVNAIREIHDRVMGKAVDQIEVREKKKLVVLNDG
jgi:ribosomal protein L17